MNQKRFIDMNVRESGDLGIDCPIYRKVASSSTPRLVARLG